MRYDEHGLSPRGLTLNMERLEAVREMPQFREQRHAVTGRFVRDGNAALDRDDRPQFDRVHVRYTHELAALAALAGVS